MVEAWGAAVKAPRCEGAWPERQSHCRPHNIDFVVVDFIDVYVVVGSGVDVIDVNAVGYVVAVVIYRCTNKFYQGS